MINEEIIEYVHDLPLYLICPDVLSLVGKLLSGIRVALIVYSYHYLFIYMFICF